MRLTFSLCWLCVSIDVFAFVRASNIQPISIDFGPKFIGYDGDWSPVSIRTGTPEQWMLLFPSTLSSETWLAGQGLCNGQTCQSLRGGLFQNSTSTTWQSIGGYEMGYSELLQRTPTAEYGFDTLWISDTISAPDQIVALVDDLDHWIGSFGLNVQNSRFSSPNNTLPFLSTLVQNLSLVPSHSYGYTAGASYQAGGIAGSLTFGGVDTNRYRNSDIWYGLTAGYVPTITLRSLNVTAASIPSNWATNPLPLVSDNQAATFTIDSSTPYMWLPEGVCDTIATALNLTWNSTINLYTYAGNSSHQSLLDQQLTFTFTVTDATAEAATQELTLSYNALNLQLSYPFPGAFEDYSASRINYFPLRRANDTRQYTIGRAFLQEVYLIVDYERNTFSLNEALFPANSAQKPNLAVISRPKDSTWPGPTDDSGSSGLPKGMKVGITVGVIVASFLALAIGGYIYLKRRGRVSRMSMTSRSEKGGFRSIISKRSTITSHVADSAAELQADKRHPTELLCDKTNSKFELAAAAPVEMPGTEAPPSFFQERTNARIMQRNDPRSPVELIQPLSRSSVSKHSEDGAAFQPQEAAAPAYSLSDMNSRYEDSLSPNSQGYHSNPFSSDGDHIVSPITGAGSDQGATSRTFHSEFADVSSRFSTSESPTDARGLTYSSTDRSRYNSADVIGGQNEVSAQSSLSPVSVAVSNMRRSLSRDSRFREELSMDDIPSEVQEWGRRANSPIDAPARGQRRFSWEHSNT